MKVEECATCHTGVESEEDLEAMPAELGSAIEKLEQQVRKIEAL